MREGRERGEGGRGRRRRGGSRKCVRKKIGIMKEGRGRGGGGGRGEECDARRIKAGK